MRVFERSRRTDRVLFDHAVLVLVIAPSRPLPYVSHRTWSLTHIINFRDRWAPPNVSLPLPCLREQLAHYERTWSRRPGDGAQQWHPAIVGSTIHLA